MSQALRTSLLMDNNPDSEILSNRLSNLEEPENLSAKAHLLLAVESLNLYER